MSLRQPTTVCLFAYLKNHATALYQILCMHVALARSSSDVVVICYVLPVLRVISSRVTRERYSWNYCTSFKNIFLDDKDYQVHVVTCALGAKSAILDCLIASENESWVELTFECVCLFLHSGHEWYITGRRWMDQVELWRDRLLSSQLFTSTVDASYQPVVHWSRGTQSQCISG